MNIILITISIFSIISALAVLISNNPVFATLFLILVFFFSSLFVFFLGLDFLAFIFIIIYIGAIAVLFLFVIMMLKVSRFKSITNNDTVLTLVSFFLLVLNFVYIPAMISNYTEMLYNNKFLDFNYIKEVSLYTVNANSIGLFFYTHYGIIFVMSGIILLIGMVGAIILTLQKNYNTRKQLDYKQVLTKYKKNIILKINK
jgi:NADH:ubiquinone oxidoreductase subunit 6 (subunit J)